MKIRGFILRIALALIFLCCALPDTIAKDQDQANMKYAETTEVLEFNPLLIKEDVSLRFTTLIYSSLVGDNSDLRLQPELLESLTPISHQGLSYTFRLRKLRNKAGGEENIKWVGFSEQQNKVVTLKDFTAEDVVYTFNAIKSSRTPTMYEYIKTLFSEVKLVKGDDHLVEFVLNPSMSYMAEDINSILRLLKVPITPYLSPDTEYDCVEIKGRRIIGTGPFVAAQDLGRTIMLVRNPYYFEPPLIEKSLKQQEIGRIAMNEYPDSFSAKEDLLISDPKSLKVHLITNLPLQYRREVKDLPNVTTERYATNRFNYFAYNCKGAFSDVRTRQAFTHAINRKEMFINIYGDIYPDLQDKPLIDIKEILHSPLPPGENPPDIKPLEFDVAKAKQLLNVAKFARKKVTLLTYRGDPDENRICESFKTYIKNNLDIEVEILGVTMTEWKSKFYSGDFDIAFGNWFFNNDVNIIRALFSESSPSNVVKYINPAIESQLRKYEQTSKPELKVKILHDMAKIISADVPYTFLFQLPKYTAFRNDVLRVTALHPYNFFDFVEDWYMLKP